MLRDLLVLLAWTSATLAATTCNTDLALYPYCISVPDGAAKGSKIPTVLFLSGRGARGSDVQSLSTYDGFGKLVSSYNSGNRGEAETIAATKFITIVPVAPLELSSADPQYWHNELLSNVLADVKAKGYPVDYDRFHCSGYSMGAFGTYRNAAFNPTLCASMLISGGNAETNTITDTNGQTQQAPAELLDGLIARKIPIRAYTGSGDTTIPPSWLEQTQSTLEGLGAGQLATLTTLDTDHSGLSTIPFSAENLNWMLQQKRMGAKSPSKGKPKPKKGKGKKKTTSKKTPASPASTKKKCTAAQAARKRAKRAHLASVKRHLALGQRGDRSL